MSRIGNIELEEGRPGLSRAERSRRHAEKLQREMIEAVESVPGKLLVRDPEDDLSGDFPSEPEFKRRISKALRAEMRQHAED